MKSIDLVLIMGSAIALAFALILRVELIPDRSGNGTGQIGGTYDPYRNIRPWIIIDALRNFWLTK